MKHLSFYLISATFVIGNIWQYWYEEVTPRHEHINGAIGYYIEWHVWYLCISINFVIMAFISTLKYNELPINKAAIWSFIIWSIIGIIKYLWVGVSNSSYYMIELGYIATTILLYKLWDSNK